MKTVVDKHRLKRLLKALIEDAHYNAVVGFVLANKAGESQHRSIDDLNGSYDRLHEMLDEAIHDEPDDEQEEQPP